MSDVIRSELFESLERRVMLSYDPKTFPDLASLANEENTVIRFNTDLGFIDIELFDRAGPDGAIATAAPNTVANFLNYVMGGDFDGTIDLPAGLEDVSGYPRLLAELSGRGWSDRDLDKLAGGNILRVLREAERLAQEPLWPLTPAR